LDVLRGVGPEDVTELTLAFGEEMLGLAGIDGGRDRLRETIDSGAALQKLIDVTIAHGGDPAVIENPDLLPSCANESVVEAESDGYVTRCDALTIGIAATRLGAGRERKEDSIDPGVGITLEAKVGDRVTAGMPLARVRYSDQHRWEAQGDLLASAWSIQDDVPPAPVLTIERIAEADGI
jgi:thymidine phosphorylase